MKQLSVDLYLLMRLPAPPPPPVVWEVKIHMNETCNMQIAGFLLS